MESIYEWFLEKPQRSIDFGRSFYWVGFFLLIVGLCGRVATTSSSVIANLVPAAQSQQAKTLAEVYPTLPTWWIPEHFIGFFFVVALILVGIILEMQGKKYKRILN